MKIGHVVLLLALLAHATPARAGVWTQQQIQDSSPTLPILWSEAHVYGGLDASNVPLHPVAWSELARYASLPAQAMVARAATPRTEPPTPLELFRPEQIRSRLRFDYDAMLTNVIYIVHHGERWGDRIFDMHMLEDIFVPLTKDLRFRNKRAVNDNLFLWSRPAGYQAGRDRDEYLFYMIQGEAIYIEVAGRVWVEGNDFRFEAVVVNHSQQAWDDPLHTKDGALMCFRCRNAADFSDYLGERVYYCRQQGAGFVPMQSVYNAEGRVNQYFFQWIPSYEPNPGGLANALLKTSRDGQLRVMFSAWPPLSVGGNRDDDICCIHANFGFDIPVGGSQLIEARAQFITFSAARGWGGYR